MLWSAAMEKGYAAPVWMTFKQARELKANVRTGEHGSLVVYADKIIGGTSSATLPLPTITATLPERSNAQSR